MSNELKPANDLIVDLISIIARTGLKNIDIGNEFGNNFHPVYDGIQKIKNSDTEKLFEIFHKLSFFRDASRNVFHGSVISSIIDGNLDLSNLIEVGRDVSSCFGKATELKLVSYWDKLSSILAKQKDATERMCGIMTSWFDGDKATPEEKQEVVELYNTTIEYIEEDISLYKK